MKLLYVFAAILAFSLAEEDKSTIEDLEAAATNVELMKESPDLQAEASAYSYVPPSQRPPQWQVNPPQNSWNPPSEPIKPWSPPIQSDVPQPSPTYPPAQHNYPPVQQNYPPVQPSYPPVQPSYPPVQPSYPPVQPTYPPVQQTWSTPHYRPSTTTTPLPVIKNEQYYGDNGSYKYEYQIADGTWVGEEGYFTDPNGSEESLVKKGWYSYVGADGKTYTVTYWADKTGFHAFGDHLPTPPPVPAAIQAALDKEKEVTPAPTVAPTYNPTYPSQQHVYPQQTYPVQPVHTNPQQTYYPQQTYPQQTYPQQPTYGK